VTADGLIVGYVASPPRGRGSGLRVRKDGTVELSSEGSDWGRIGTMTEDECEQLAELTRAAGIPDLPPEVERPEGLLGGNDCEWWTDLDGGSHSVIHGWTDENPAAKPSRDLVMKLSELVSAAQAREASD
jgi:hypothetical protein